MLSLGVERGWLVCGLVVVGLMVCSAVLSGPAEAQGQLEHFPCRVSGATFSFSYDTLEVDGKVIPGGGSVEVKQSPISVVAANKYGLRKEHLDMGWICARAAQCFVQVAAGAEFCTTTDSYVVFEIEKKPGDVHAWRRQLACNQARAGNMTFVRYTNANTVTVKSATIYAGGGQTWADAEGYADIDESNHVCWTADPDRRPSRTDATHRPSRTNSPSPITAINLTVTPPEQRGKCPASVAMEARLQLSEPAEVRWWVTGEDGYESPKYVRSFTKPQESLIWRRHIDPKPTTGGLTQKPGNKPTSPIHRGFFQLHFETASDQGRAIPLGESNRASFVVDCNLPDRFKK